MESGRINFIMGYDPLGWGGNIHGIRKNKFYHGIRPFRVGGEHSWNQEDKKITWDGWGGTFMESGRGNFIMGHDPLGWRGGRTSMESGRRNFIMGQDPLGWGGTFMESDPLGSGRGEHSWNQEEIVLTWDTIL